MKRVGQPNDIKGLAQAGARLDWNVSPNIELVRLSDPSKANFLHRLANELSAAAQMLPVAV